MQRLLIVEDDHALRRALSAALSPRVGSVTSCGSVREARSALPAFRPDVMVLDVYLPDGTALDVLEVAQALPALPIIVAISGQARPEESFLLAQQGVRAFVPKPLDLAALEQALDRVTAEPPDLVPHLRGAVGHAPVRDVESAVRRTMVTEALGRTRGSKSGAAKILRVSRQLLQHMVRSTLD